METDQRTRKATLGQEWRPLTDEHERQLDRAEETFDRFVDGRPVDPLALVGAYRSGKTQLLYHLFDESWEHGIPAFYVGDPGELLTEFAAADETDLNEWLQSRIDEQLAAYAEGRASDVQWFPNVDTESKREFVKARSSEITTDGPVRTALLFDEVEQSYRAFIRAMDKDDDNPLRKINDGLQDSIKVWSFGMISAFEFIGEADWGRMREIRIPPLGAQDVRELLSRELPGATDLANVLWWLARGRTGLIIKFLDDLPAGDEDALVEWMRDLAETDFRDTRLVNSLWSGLDRDQWDQGIRALLFEQDGLAAWQIDDRGALSVSRCQYVAIDALKHLYSFAGTERDQDALEILDRNVERVLSGLAVTDEHLLPAQGFSDRAQADAFLALVSDMVVSFEPASQARSVAIEALDDAEETFHTVWANEVADLAVIDRSIATTAPTVVRSAFPPIAVNPERVSERATESLRESMDRGLAVETGSPANDVVDVRFCPTEEAFAAERTAVAGQLDLTAPTVLVVPEDSEFDSATDSLAAYTDHHLLGIETYRSNRFWTFVLQLYGRLVDSGVPEPHRVDGRRVSQLLDECPDREIRNTIETLYDQLRQVADEYSGTLEATYRDAYSFDGTDRLLWEESRLTGAKPYWSSGKFIESTVTLSYLLALGPAYDPDREYVTLHRRLAAGLEDDLVVGGRGGFQFKSYLDSLFTQNGYSKAVETERAHYRNEGELAPPVAQTIDVLAEVATDGDLSDTLDVIDDRTATLQSDRLPAIDIDGFSRLGSAFVRALLVAGLTTGTDPAIDIAERLRQVKSDIEAQHRTIDACRERVNEYRKQLRPPSTAAVGTWIDIDADRLDRYAANLDAVKQGVGDLVDAVTTDHSVGPIAYHYWFLLRSYVADMAEQLDGIEAAITASSVEQIVEATEVFDDVYSTVAEAAFIEPVFGDRAAMLDRLESYGDEAFDLEAHLEQTAVAVADDEAMLTQVEQYDEQILVTDPGTGFTRLDVPGEINALEQLDRIVATHKQHLMRLRGELGTIAATHAAIDDLAEETRDELLALLAAQPATEGADV